HNIPAMAQAPAAAPSATSSNMLPPELSPVKGGMPMDYDMKRSGSNILLGTLLFEAGMINKPTLDAALKLQDMVREGKITNVDAPDYLKRLHDMGGSIEQYVNRTPTGELGKKPAPKQVSTSPSRPSAEQVAEQRAVFDLLQKAGLLSEEDLKVASGVRN